MGYGHHSEVRLRVGRLYLFNVAKRQRSLAGRHKIMKIKHLIDFRRWTYTYGN